ncbi:MAG: hypothetical protein ACYS6W_07930 [Planctomycetota bacterium]|jgi:hypothetical protein
MKKGYGIILVLAMAAVLTVSALPGLAERGSKEKKENIWTEEEPRGPRRGPGRRRFQLTDEEIDRIMKGLKERDPAKAKELTKLREKEPDKFRLELRNVAREEFGKIIRERIENWRQRRQAEFIEWLGKNYPPEAKILTTLKEKDPKLFITAFDRAMEKYGYIYRAWLQNPELGRVLKEKLELKEKQDKLLRRIRDARNDKEKEELTRQLQEVVSSRFDLMVREKQIAYKQLLKRLEELKKRVEESQAEVDELMDPKFKKQKVDARVEELIGRTKGLRWD